MIVCALDMGCAGYASGCGDALIAGCNRQIRLVGLDESICMLYAVKHDRL